MFQYLFKKDDEEVLKDENYYRQIEILDKYKKCVQKMDLMLLRDRTEKAHRFYEGDQWNGLKSDGEDLPVFNILKSIVKYKTAVVSQNTLSATYTPLGERNTDVLKVCEELNLYFAKMWERGKLDILSWGIIKDACIQGDSYLYFGDGNDVTKAEKIKNVNIFFEDEENPNIQEQKYIFIRERLYVEDVKKEARKNNISEEDISLIVKDTDYDFYDYKNNPTLDLYEEDKCTSIFYFYKDDEGYVHFLKMTKNVIYVPDTILRVHDNAGNFTNVGLKLYPIVNFLWEEKYNSARGNSEILNIIPNQIEINKTLARRLITIKQTAFPKVVFSENQVLNPDDIDTVGAKISVRTSQAQEVNDLITYLPPIQMSPDAKNISDELMMMTRELAGAGDSATGSIDPTKASGAAIIAVKDQAALPLNEQFARFSQFVEDIAYLWFEFWCTYNPNGFFIHTNDNEKVFVSPEILRDLKINVRVDISRNNPFSKFAQEQGLEHLLQMQLISFEEYVKALDHDSAIPKGKLVDILNAREANQNNQMQNIPPGMIPGMNIPHEVPERNPDMS